MAPTTIGRVRHGRHRETGTQGGLFRPDGLQVPLLFLESMTEYDRECGIPIVPIATVEASHQEGAREQNSDYQR